MKTLMFKEKKKHEIKNWFDNFIDAYTHPKKKIQNKNKLYCQWKYWIQLSLNTFAQVFS